MKRFTAQAIKAALAASQAMIIEAAIKSGKATGPAAMFVVPLMIAAGMAIVDSAFGQVSAFADGGLVTGPTMGLVGEGPGTSMSNPEVIAPLDKLQSMMGGGHVTVTGMIRGTRALGLGLIAGKHGEPSDGSVTVSETELVGLKDSVELDVSHTEMLVSAEVVEQVEQFLFHGKFDKGS